MCLACEWATSVKKYHGTMALKYTKLLDESDSCARVKCELWKSFAMYLDILPRSDSTVF